MGLSVCTAGSPDYFADSAWRAPVRDLSRRSGAPQGWGAWVHGSARARDFPIPKAAQLRSRPTLAGHGPASGSARCTRSTPAFVEDPVRLLEARSTVSSIRSGAHTARLRIHPPRGPSARSRTVPSLGRRDLGPFRADSVGSPARKHSRLRRYRTVSSESHRPIRSASS